MRINRVVCSLGGAAFALGTIVGCGGSSDEKVDLAKLPPPSQEAIDRAKAQPLPKGRPRFGAPPKSAQVQP